MKVKHITENGKTYKVENYPDGASFWSLDNKIHRENGPAIEWRKGQKEWALNGKYHREDGPSIEDLNGNKGWWLGNRDFTEEEHQNKTQEINKFYEAYSVGDIILGNYILLGKRSIPIAKFFKVYDIKEKKVYEELVYEIMRL